MTVRDARVMVGFAKVFRARWSGSWCLLEWRCGSVYALRLVLGYVDFYRTCGFVECCAECLLNVLQCELVFY